VQETGQIPDCSFYLAVSMSQDDPEETKHGGEKEEAESPSKRDVGVDHMLWES